MNNSWSYCRLSCVAVALVCSALVGCGSSDTSGPLAGPQSAGPQSVDSTDAQEESQEVPPKEAVNQDTQGRYRESRFMRAPDQFIAADVPRMVTATEASFLSDDDEVLGFVIGGEARAYSVSALSYHHVVNDQIGDTALAVTY